jgi:alpha-tubulin suppressor-like RCC1 family protein
MSYGWALKAMEVAAGGFHNLAVTAEGLVWAWEWNGFGQFGNGTTIDSRTPTLVAGLTQVTSVYAGLAHSVAIRVT